MYQPTYNQRSTKQIANSRQTQLIVSKPQSSVQTPTKVNNVMFSKHVLSNSISKGVPQAQILLNQQSLYKKQSLRAVDFMPNPNIFSKTIEQKDRRINNSSVERKYTTQNQQDPFSYQNSDEEINLHNENFITFDKKNKVQRLQQFGVTQINSGSRSTSKLPENHVHIQQVSIQRMQKSQHKQPRQTKSIINEDQPLTQPIQSPSRNFLKKQSLDERASQTFQLMVLSFQNQKKDPTSPTAAMQKKVQSNFLQHTLSSSFKKNSISPNKKQNKFCSPIKQSFQQYATIQTETDTQKKRPSKSIVKPQKELQRAMRPASKRGVEESSLTRQPIEMMRSKMFLKAAAQQEDIQLVKINQQNQSHQNRDFYYKQKQDDIIRRIESNMLKSEQLDRMMVKTIVQPLKQDSSIKLWAKKLEEVVIVKAEETEIDEKIDFGPPRQNNFQQQVQPVHRSTESAEQQESLDNIDEIIEQIEDISLPCTGIQYIQKYREQMTQFEVRELSQLQSLVYYKPQSSTDGSNQDDQEGYLLVKPFDDILYRFQILSILGKGSFAQVVSAFDNKTKQKVAIKINRNTELDHQFADSERIILKQLMQEDPLDMYNIVRMKEHLRWRDHQIFVFELLHKDLFQHIQDNNYEGFKVPVIRDYTSQILKALKFLEDRQIIHCDLKPENILLCDENAQQIKLVDFGSGCKTSEQVYTYVQSRFYRAPEVVLRIPYSTKVDMWSLGCIIAELYTGEPLFPGNSEQELLEYHMEILGIPTQELISKSRKQDHYFDVDFSPYLIEDPELGILRFPSAKPLEQAVPTTDNLLLDFIGKCLQMDPGKRWRAKEALEHPFITGNQIIKSPIKKHVKVSSPIETILGFSPIKRSQIRETNKIQTVSDPMIMQKKRK